MIEHEHAQLMLTTANRDLKALGRLIDDLEIDDTILGFHAQQAIEKGLKAWLDLQAVMYPKTHSIRQLLDLLVDKNVEIPQEYWQFTDLTSFALGLRYEVIGNKWTPQEREELCESVEDFLQYVQALVDERGPII